jgi:hypothetical protein
VTKGKDEDASGNFQGRDVESFLAAHGTDVTGVIATLVRLPLRASPR